MLPRILINVFITFTFFLSGIVLISPQKLHAQEPDPVAGPIANPATQAPTQVVTVAPTAAPTTNPSSPTLNLGSIPSSTAINTSGQVIVNNCPASGFLMCSITPQGSTDASYIRCPTSQGGCTRQGNSITCNVSFNTPGTWLFQANCSASNPFTPVRTSQFSRSVTVTGPVVSLAPTPVTISVPSSITWKNNDQVLTITNLIRPTSGQTEYTLRLSKTTSSSPIDYGLTLLINSNGSCTVEYDNFNEDSDDILKKPSNICQESSNGNVNAFIQLNTSSLPKPVGSITGQTGLPLGGTGILSDTYRVTIGDGNFQSSDTFSLNTTSLITVRVENSGGSPSLNGDGEFAIYENTPSTLIAEGCEPNEKVEFRWWHGGDKECAYLDPNSPNACEKDEPDGDSAEVTANSNGTATYPKDNFDNDGKPRTFGIRAYCETSKKYSYTTLTVFDKGYEQAVIVPEEPTPNTPFEVQLIGLEDNGQCYFFKIKNLSTGEFIHPEGERTEECDDGIDTGNIFYSDHKGQMYGSFRSESPEKVLSIRGLSTGTYRFELWTPRKQAAIGSDANAKTDTQKGSATVKFGVGMDPEDIPPPKPPCLDDLDVTGKCNTVNTAFGSINVNPAEFLRDILGVILSISGAIALLLIIYSGYKYMASNGNPEAIQAARETLTSAIVGLLFIIFSLVILQVIGVDILRLPGFGN